MSHVARKPDFCLCENRATLQNRIFAYGKTKVQISCAVDWFSRAATHIVYNLRNTKKNLYFNSVLYEPRREKTGLRGFRQGPTQNSLYSHRRRLDT